MNQIHVDADIVKTTSPFTNEWFNNCSYAYWNANYIIYLAIAVVSKIFHQTIIEVYIKKFLNDQYHELTAGTMITILLCFFFYTYNIDFTYWMNAEVWAYLQTPAGYMTL